MLLNCWALDCYKRNSIRTPQVSVQWESDAHRGNHRGDYTLQQHPHDAPQGTGDVQLCGADAGYTGTSGLKIHLCVYLSAGISYFLTPRGRCAPLLPPHQIHITPLSSHTAYALAQNHTKWFPTSTSLLLECSPSSLNRNGLLSSLRAHFTPRKSLPWPSLLASSSCISLTTAWNHPFQWWLELLFSCLPH